MPKTEEHEARADPPSITGKHLFKVKRARNDQVVICHVIHAYHTKYFHIMVIVKHNRKEALHRNLYKKFIQTSPYAGIQVKVLSKKINESGFE